MRPISIPQSVKKYLGDQTSQQALCDAAALGCKRLLKGTPEVSIVIPAYNEEFTIAATLASLAENITSRSVEIVVVDNNSADRTAEIAMKCGARCVPQPLQGITHARNMGLSLAKGKYIMNADADTIYPKDWIELMVKPLDSSEVSLTYGRFSFIPTAGTGRFVYFFYEMIADFSRWLNRNFHEEGVNVYGFNSAFRREQGLSVDSFNHPSHTNEDGWLAMKLRNAGYGKLNYVHHPKARVWTTDRRIQIDGGLLKGSWKRIKRIISGLTPRNVAHP